MTTVALETDTILCGDNVKILRTFPDDCIDLTVTSPPYDLVDYDDNGRLVTYPDKGLRNYNGYSWDFVSLADELYRVTKPGGVVVWVVNDATVDGSETLSSFRQALYFRQIGFLTHDTMIYKAAGVGAKGSHYAYWQSFEYMFVLSKGQPSTINRIRDKVNNNAGKPHGSSDKYNSINSRISNGYTTQKHGIRENVWEYFVGNTNGGDITNHPAPFPESLAHDHIISWSNPGDLVLDPFIGSGTTAKMAAKTDRHYIGIDVSEEYCQLARRRVAAVKAQPKLFSWDLQPAVNGKDPA